MNRFIAFFICCLPFLTLAQKPAIYYVSATGKDSNPGTIAKPFATIQKARNVIREQKKGNPNNSFTVFIRKGNYFIDSGLVFDSLDGGTKEYPVLYTAYNNEDVHFTGGITVPINKAVVVKNTKIKAKLLPEVVGKLLQLNLKALGIKDYGTIHSKGFGHPYSTSAMEVFCNGEPLQMARWPNDSSVPIGKVIDAGSIPRNGDYSNRGGVFQYNSDRPQRWTEANDFWISGFFKYGYADDAVKIAKLDTVNKTFTTQQPTMYGFESGNVFQRWYAFNLLEEVDRPGEYYIDRDAGILYFIPPAGKLESIELSVSEQPLLSLENCSYVHIKHITFECARGIGVYIDGGKENKIDSCIFRNLGMLAVSIGKGIKPFDNLTVSGTGEVMPGLIGSLYAHLYANTIFNREAGFGHIISNCQIYNTGSGGISMGGGDRLTLQKGNNQVINCRIYNFNRIERSYKAGINIDGVGNLIRNCEIYNCPGSAILLHGNDHVIEYNNIHDAVKEGDDMGAIYYGRDPSEFGNLVRYNFFHHLGNDHGYLVAVYHDDGACGMQMYGNVFYKAGARASLIGGGNDNVYRNNIFIDCQTAIHLDNRLQGWGKSMVDRNNIFEQRLQAVNYQQPPYSIAYPSLVNYFDDQPGLPKRNYVEGNVFVNTKIITDGKAEWSNVGKNITFFGDPGFVDAEKMNFELKPSSEVFKLVPEFKNIPFNKIGIQ